MRYVDVHEKRDEAHQPKNNQMITLFLFSIDLLSLVELNKANLLSYSADETAVDFVSWKITFNDFMKQI